MKRITIIASGTRGDVQPAIALGKALQRAGSRVRLLASRDFREWITGHGLEAAPAQVDMQTLMASPAGRKWVEQGHNPLAQQRAMGKLINQFGAQLIREAWAACQDADTIISSFTSDTYALAIAEKRQVPLLTMPLQPSLIATRNGRCMPNVPFPRRISRINEWFCRLVIEPFPWQLYGAHVNRFRREISLPQQTNKEYVSARRQMATLHAVSRHVLPFPADWPDNFHITGYWFLGEDEGWQPPEELWKFLAAGAPPVCVGFGSMTTSSPEETTRLIVEAVQRSDQRAVLLSGWAGMGQLELPPQILRLAGAPHSWLFPRMAAVVHHGGAGTTAEGLRAGKPTVVIPHMVDQPYWGQRVYDLGAGPKPVARHKLTAVRLANAIQHAMQDPQIRQNAAALGEKIRAEDGLGRAVDIIRQVVQ